MKENYLIAVLTDFGMKDGFVGTMKGVIYGINPLARIVDISHEISPQNLLEASFILKSSVDYFPVNTVFLVVVDPGVGSSRRNIILKTPSFLYVSPDNGVLSRIYREEKEIDIIEITNSAYFLRELSNTFYGRDLFAPVSAHLSLGVDPYLMGNKIHDPVIIPEILPVCHKNKACGDVIYIDRFGNLITSFSKEFFQINDISYEDIRIQIKDKKISNLSRSYSDNPAGSLLAIIGSSNYLEIAVNQGNAGEMLQWKQGDKVYCEWGRSET